MKKRIILVICNLILLLCCTLMCTKSFAKSKVDLVLSKNRVEVEEEFSLAINANNAELAACTIWIYFDPEKVDCVSQEEINVLENRIIYTWISETGKNEKVDHFISILFKAKQEGIASFSIVGEFYDQNGEKVDMEYNQVEVVIGEENSVAVQKETEELEETSEAVSDSNAKLKIMRLNREGVNPDFNPDIKEYYVIVEENIDKLNITAIPENAEANIQISGNEKLKSGLNTISIKVTSKDRSNSEEYFIYVTKTNNIEEANANLGILAIENYSLVPEYQETVTNYQVEVSYQTDKLNILAIPVKENANVKISGNENLTLGENQILVNVTAPNGVTTKKYVIHAYRRNEEEENSYIEEQENAIEEANQVIENRDKEEAAENREQEGESQETIEDVTFRIVGTVLSIIVIGIVVIRIRKKSF